MYGLLSKRHNARSRVGVGDSPHVHAVIEEEEFVRMMVLGRPVDHYKLLHWMCVAMVSVNPGLVAVCEVDEYKF